MRMNLGILRYGWLVIGSLFVACDDATGPGRRFTDTYVLQYVDGDPLPFSIELEHIMPRALLAEELDFRSSGEVIRVRTIRHSRRERGDTTETVVMHHAYQVRDSEIEIGAFGECPDTADCVPNDHGTLTADGLELQAYSLPFVEPPLLTYQRRSSERALAVEWGFRALLPPLDLFEGSPTGSVFGVDHWGSFPPF